MSPVDFRLNYVVYPIPRFEGTDEPCIKSTIFPCASYKLHIICIFLIGYDAIFCASQFIIQSPTASFEVCMSKILKLLLEAIQDWSPTFLQKFNVLR